MNLVESDSLVQLERLPGFRNILVHEYVALDLDRVLDALDALQPIEDFYRAVHSLLSKGDSSKS